MSKYGSNAVALEIDTADGGSQSTGFIQYVTKIGDIVVKKESIESTPFGVTAESYLQGIIARHEPITIEGFYDDTATTGPDAILNIGKVTHAVTRTMTITLGGSKTISGEVWIESYQRTLESGQYHGYSATVRFTGTVTEA